MFYAHVLCVNTCCTVSCIYLITQGLPPLTKVPSQQETPHRLDRRSVLPPVKGGLVAFQASKALASGGPGDTAGSTGVAMPDRPARLPPLQGSSLFGPTNMPDKPIHVPPLQRLDKGKAPVGGNLLPKKGNQPPVGEEGKPGDSRPVRLSLPGVPSVPAPLRMMRPLPGIRQKQSLSHIGSPTRPLPAISNRTPLPGLTSPTSSMPPRRFPPDPFTTGLNPTSSALTGLTSPARMTPAPLQSVPLPVTRPTLSPIKSPPKVSTVGPMSPPAATKPPHEPSAVTTPPPPPESDPPSNDATGETPATNNA